MPQVLTSAQAEIFRGSFANVAHGWQRDPTNELIIPRSLVSGSAGGAVSTTFLEDKHEAFTVFSKPLASHVPVDAAELTPALLEITIIIKTDGQTGNEALQIMYAGVTLTSADPALITAVRSIPIEDNAALSRLTAALSATVA
ncbi:MAG: hypothetical protein AAFO79_01170 [Pseudomonadota bacterium]